MQPSKPPFKPHQPITDPKLATMPADDGTPIDEETTPVPGMTDAMPELVVRAMGDAKPIGPWNDPDGGAAIPLHHYMAGAGLSSAVAATFRAFCRTHGLIREKYSPKQWSILFARNETRPVR